MKTTLKIDIDGVEMTLMPRMLLHNKKAAFSEYFFTVHPVCFIRVGLLGSVTMHMQNFRDILLRDYNKSLCLGQCICELLQ